MKQQILYLDIYKIKKTVREVKDYLSKKGYDEDIVELTSNYLIEKGYIDDKKYASAFVHDKLKINKYGRNKIKKSFINAWNR